MSLGAPYFVKMNQIPIKEQNEVLIKFIMDLNKRFSKRLLYHHMLSVSPVHNLKYGLQKLKKGMKR